MKKKVIMGTMLMLLSIVLVGCTKVYEDTGAKSYKVISNVKGLTFDVYSSILDDCLFCTGILETDQFNNAKTYVYRNDTTDYMVYNSKSYGIVAQKIDSLNLKGQNKNYIKASLSDIYFLNTSVTSKASAISYKDKSTKGVTKYLVTKPIEVGIAPNVLSFQNYYGYMAYLETTDGTAYAIFAGTIKNADEMDDDIKDILMHIVSSATIDKSASLASISESETSISEVSPISEETVVSVSEEVKEETSVSVSEEPTEQPIKETNPKVTYEEISETDKLKTPIYVSAYNGTATDSMIFVSVKAINHDAEGEVKKMDSEYLKPSDGCHLEMIEYELLNTETELDTVRINVVGSDFENLTYNGLKYSKRTYEASKNGKLYVYYEIPNGCKEYVLEIGATAKKGYFYVK